MKLTAQVKLCPSPEQAQALKKTLEVANAACNHISAWAWENKTFGQYRIQKGVYGEVKALFGLTAQVVVRCIAKVADAYKLDRKKKRTFRPHGSIAYDDRILRWYVDRGEVSIWADGKRRRVPFICGDQQRKLLASRQGESDLVFFGGNFYLLATCNVVDPTPTETKGFLGVDLGIKNIATDSTGETFSGGLVNGLRKRHAKLRAQLQAKGTKSAKRLLKKRRRKEARFARYVNHCISKKLVVKAKDTGKGIALENLKGIRSRITVHRSQRRIQHSWAFAQLRAFIEYKAKLAGVPIVLVDPRNTSRTCPKCGCVDKANRSSQAVFSCVSCAFSGHADHVAADIIRRVAVNRPYADAAD
ncbi:MAG: transposase [Candidatus Handelsmanbacteria bacterium RIFCSPLOWO2_12_FULL_64_10]|uniref:Transposase n=1 Tax=Handelsmanbacteria sp. (strain RIFCSPLOWO2_12_FULL_64_10) TaxID=1817868 RepID=A0A1F6CWG1_HANXR|nr:MAG: transposase [Candidatus Handelsmanbacteria bacterium RIFCSPLOWO2_12_FULL_64_10]